MLLNAYDPCEDASGGSQTAFLALSVSVLLFVGMDAFSTMMSVFSYTNRCGGSNIANA